MRILLTQQAASDVDEAAAHHAGIDVQLSARFAENLDAAIERMTRFPHGAPPVEGFDRLRRARMRRFPYGIFDQQTPTGDLLMVRVLHSRRHHPDSLP